MTIVVDAPRPHAVPQPTTSSETDLKRGPTRVEFAVQLDGRPQIVVGRAVPPNAEAAAKLARPVWLFCMHGATVDWRYWCTRIDGHGDEYDASAFFAARGFGVLSLDIVSVGESAYPRDARELTWESVAGAHHAVVEQLRERLAKGTLLEGFPAVDNAAVLAFGHSNGAPLAVIQQSLHRSFEAIAPMALSVGPFGGFGSRISFEDGGRPPVNGEIALDEHGMVPLPRRKSRFPNHLDDVPQDVVDAKTNLTFPPFSLQMVSGTPALPHAREIDCPVFIAFGEIDTTDDLLAERSYYPKAEDVTLYIQPGMAHYHNFAGTRKELWLALSVWAQARSGALKKW